MFVNFWEPVHGGPIRLFRGLFRSGPQHTPGVQAELVIKDFYSAVPLKFTVSKNVQKCDLLLAAVIRGYFYAVRCPRRHHRPSAVAYLVSVAPLYS